MMSALSITVFLYSYMLTGRYHFHDGDGSRLPLPLSGYFTLTTHLSEVPKWQPDCESTDCNGCIAIKEHDSDF